MNKVTVEVLYPEFCNLYGDSGNILYLLKKLSLSGVEYDVTETSIFDKPEFAKKEKRVDFLYLGPCTERQQETVLKALAPYREELLERTQKSEDGEKITLITGNSFELLGKNVVRADGSEFECMKLWDSTAKRFSRLRYNEYCEGESDGIKIIGFKNQLSHSYGETPSPFLKISKGSGLNPDSKAEGFRENGFIATYLIGPILPTNPEFSNHLLKKMVPWAEIAELPFEKQAFLNKIEDNRE